MLFQETNKMVCRKIYSREQENAWNTLDFPMRATLLWHTIVYKLYSFSRRSFGLGGIIKNVILIYNLSHGRRNTSGMGKALKSQTLSVNARGISSF